MLMLFSNLFFLCHFFVFFHVGYVELEYRPVILPTTTTKKDHPTIWCYEDVLWNVWIWFELCREYSFQSKFYISGDGDVSPFRFKLRSERCSAERHTPSPRRSPPKLRSERSPSRGKGKGKGRVWNRSRRRLDDHEFLGIFAKLLVFSWNRLQSCDCRVDYELIVESSCWICSHWRDQMLFFFSWWHRFTMPSSDPGSHLPTHRSIGITLGVEQLFGGSSSLFFPRFFRTCKLVTLSFETAFGAEKDAKNFRL